HRVFDTLLVLACTVLYEPVQAQTRLQTTNPCRKLHQTSKHGYSDISQCILGIISGFFYFFYFFTQRSQYP
ncbi:hypothetical protein B0H11DRAFT_1997335, partial [Mycena galericulata]